MSYITSRGEDNRNSKLTEQDVLRIRELRASGYRLKVIAGMFNVSASTVRCVAIGRAWAHILENASQNEASVLGTKR